MRFDVITLMPEFFDIIKGQGVTGRAFDRGITKLKLWNPRDYTVDVHRTVDDRPYGGGPGMVMKAEPLRAAIDAAKAKAPSSSVIYLSPQGQQFDQQAAKQMATRKGLILLAGRYEGIDERVIDSHVDEEWSIGDYVLSGGDLAAMVLMDSIIRLLPNVLGDATSAEQDSFFNGLLDCPHYTRPDIYDDCRVPSVLLGGDHAAIRRWRLKQSLGRTWQRRPDLLDGLTLSEINQNLLDEYKLSLADDSADENGSK